jgi:acetyltransferase-like isoleucine patch superfamily enzyme
MKIVLVSAGGLIRDIFEEFEKQGHNVLGYVDIRQREDIELEYLGDDNMVFGPDVRKFICVGGIGELIQLRHSLYDRHQSSLTNLIFSDAHVSRDADISPDANVLVFSGSVVKSGVTLKENTFINSLSNLGHDVTIHSGSQISQGVLIGGSTTIGARCFVGQGANIFQGVTIGEDSIIGANALVTKDVPPKSFVIRKDEIRPREG